MLTLKLLLLSAFVPLLLLTKFPIVHAMFLPKCDFVTPVERLRTSNAVFSGKVIEVIETEGIQRTKFRVSKSWKNVGVKEITIVNVIHHEGPYFERGKSYLVYAWKQKGHLMTGGCSGTGEVEQAQNEIEQLDKWHAHNKSKSGKR